MREKENSAKSVGCSKLNLVHENWEYRVHGLTFYLLYEGTYFFPKKLSLTNFRLEKFLSSGRLPRKEQTRNKQRDLLKFAELDWLIKMINSIKVASNLFVAKQSK